MDFRHRWPGPNGSKAILIFCIGQLFRQSLSPKFYCFHDNVATSLSIIMRCFMKGFGSWQQLQNHLITLLGNVLKTNISCFVLYFSRRSVIHKRCDIWYNFYLLGNFKWRPETPTRIPIWIIPDNLVKKMKIFKFLIVILLKSQTFSLAVSDFNTETVDAKLDQIYQRQANSTLEFIFHYRDLEGLFTFFQLFVYFLYYLGTYLIMM